MSHKIKKDNPIAIKMDCPECGSTVNGLLKKSEQVLKCESCKSFIELKIRIWKEI